MTTTRQSHPSALHPLVVGFTSYLGQHGLEIGSTRQYVWLIASTVTGAGKESPGDLTSADLTHREETCAPSMVSSFKAAWNHFARYMAEEAHQPVATAPWPLTRNKQLDSNGLAYNFLFFLTPTIERTYKYWICRLQEFLKDRPAESASKEELDCFCEGLKEKDEVRFRSMWRQFAAFTAKNGITLPDLPIQSPKNSYMSICPMLVEHLTPFLQATEIWGGQLQFLTFADISPAVGGGWNVRVGFKERPDKDEVKLRGLLQRRVCFISPAVYEQHLLPMLKESYPPDGMPAKREYAIFPTQKGGSEFGLDLEFVGKIRECHHRSTKQATSAASKRVKLPGSKGLSTPTLAAFRKATAITEAELPYLLVEDLKPAASGRYELWVGPTGKKQCRASFDQHLYDTMIEPLRKAYWPNGWPEDKGQRLFPDKLEQAEPPRLEGKTIEELEKMLEDVTDPDAGDSIAEMLKSKRWEAARAKEPKP